jgi:hypothetical protein
VAAANPPPESDPFIIDSLKRTICTCMIIFAKKDRQVPAKTGRNVVIALGSIAAVVLVVLGINPSGFRSF